MKDLRAVWPNIQPDSWTIEIVVVPGSIRKKGFSPLLVMHDGVDRRQLAIWQYGALLIVMNGNDYSYSRREPRIVAKNVLSLQQTRHLAITSGKQGTHLFVDGILAAADSKWKLSIPVHGNPLRLVLGNSVYGKHGWTGDLHGLAISGEAFSAETVRLRFERWAAGHSLDFLKQETPALLYTFDPKTAGNIAAQPIRQDLQIPEKMIVLKKSFLSIPGKHLNWNRDAVGDLVLNAVGFMPLGAVLYGFLQCSSGLFTRHKKLAAVVLCMMLSLGIELAQAWIPTRVSSPTDLMLNTFGAWLGIELGELFRIALTHNRINRT